MWGGGPVGPSRLLWELTPYFRVPARFIALVMTALVPLAAFGLARLAARFQRPLHRAVFVAVVTAVSFWELSFVPPRLLSDVGTPPAEYAAVEQAPSGSLAEYPLVAADLGLNSEYLFSQRLHGRPLVNGAPRGTFADAVRDTLVGAGDHRPRRRSRRSGPPRSSCTATSIPARATAPAGGFGTGYSEIARYPDGSRVLRVVARPAPAHALYTDGFGPSEIAEPQTTARWLGAERGRIEFITWRPRRLPSAVPCGRLPAAPRLHLVGSSGRFTVVVPALGRTAEVIVDLLAGVRGSRSSASPGLRPIPDGRSVSVYIGNWRFARAGRRDASAALVPFVPTPR